GALEGEAGANRDAAARALRQREDRLRRLGCGRCEQARADLRAHPAAAERSAGPRLLGTEPLGNGRARRIRRTAEARCGGAVRQGAGTPLPSRHALPPLPRRQGSEGMHVARAAAAAKAERSDLRKPPAVVNAKAIRERFERETGDRLTMHRVRMRGLPNFDTLDAGKDEKKYGRFTIGVFPDAARARRERLLREPTEPDEHGVGWEQGD